MQKSDPISPLLSVKVELFKRGDYDFITVQDSVKHIKQEQALQILNDNTHVEFLYGGAAGGSKSWTGCADLAFKCLAYPETKWFIGRESLKRLRESTLITFFKVCAQYGIRRDIDFNYNGQDHFIEFSDGSRIDMLDLRYLPSDPLYERYGSIEYTGGWIEEGGEVNFGAYDTLKTRIGRHLNDKYGILRKLLITCNPKKNWMHSTFYRPSINGTLQNYMIYLPCLVQENPFIEKDYINALESTTDKVKKERLLKGNWDYDDNPNMLCSYDDIAAIFDNDLVKDSPDYYITADIARFGSDRARIAVWKGWVMVEQQSYNISKTTLLQDAINHLRAKYRIPKKQAIADEDGVGGGVVDNCGILGFSNGGKPFDDENYQNLQAQCAYKLAEKINAHEVAITCPLSTEEKEEIINELQQLQTFDSDSDKKLKIKPKEQIKQDIGHSPDWRDLMLMRSYFEYRHHKRQDLSQLASALP